MSTRSFIVRAAASLAVLIALLAGPSLAYAGGTGANGSGQVQGKVAALTTAARAKAARLAMGGMSVGANVAWGVGTGAFAIQSAMSGDHSGVAIFGGFAAYNVVQAIRKWKAENLMNK